MLSRFIIVISLFCWTGFRLSLLVLSWLYIAYSVYCLRQFLSVRLGVFGWWWSLSVSLHILYGFISIIYSHVANILLGRLLLQNWILKIWRLERKGILYTGKFSKRCTATPCGRCLAPSIGVGKKRIRWKSSLSLIYIQYFRVAWTAFAATECYTLLYKVGNHVCLVWSLILRTVTPYYIYKGWCWLSFWGLKSIDFKSNKSCK